MMIIITAEQKAEACALQSELTVKKKTHKRNQWFCPLLSSLPLKNLVSGCKQTVALTFLTNELFLFNDPFCTKKKKGS